jgi:hypothetical protein
MDLHVFSIPEYERVVYGMPFVCVSLYVCMYASSSLAPEHLDGFYSYSVFNNLSIGEGGTR